MDISSDMHELTVRLQEAVRVRDRAHLDAAVSDRMIWIRPFAGDARGKREWIDASCSVDWNWFEVSIRRVVDLGTTRVVECWIDQQYRPAPDGNPDAAPTPVTADGVVSDVWTLEDGAWRLVARHPQKAAG